MRSKLLKSFFYVFGFWWTVLALWWSLADPATNYEGLLRLQRLLPFLPLSVPDGPVNVLHAWSMQKQVLMYWCIPLIAISGISTTIGAGIIWARTWGQHKERIARETPNGNYRGASVSLGPLPIPIRTKREILELGAADSEAFACMSPEEKALLVDIIGIISAHPEAYAGSGLGVSLLEHTVRVVEEALSSKNRPGLSAIVAAAHETGKLTAYTKEANGEWRLAKNQDREAAKHLSTLDSWWALPSDVRIAILFAVKYRGAPANLPEIDDNPHIHKMAKDLLYRAAESGEKVSTVAKARVLEKQELPAVALKGFLDALPTLPFQDGLPKGVKAVGWKVGSRLFLLEIKLRETIMAKLDPDIRAALEGAFKDRTKLATFTQEFLKALDSKGWLVKEHEKTKLEAKDALWTILAGKFDYKGVIIIDIPKEYAEVLPSKDSLYEIKIKGPLFAQPASQGVTANDLTDLGLFKKPSPAKAESEAAPAARPAPAAAEAAPATAAKSALTKASELEDLGLFKKSVPAKTASESSSASTPTAASKPLPVKTPPANASE